jgi:hypothetical protein
MIFERASSYQPLAILANLLTPRWPNGQSPKNKNKQPQILRFAQDDKRIVLDDKQYHSPS